MKALSSSSFWDERRRRRRKHEQLRRHVAVQRDRPEILIGLRVVEIDCVGVNYAEGGIHEPNTLVRVAYIRDGKVHAVRAKNCILACYNSIVRFLAPELPEPQKEALAYPLKFPSCIRVSLFGIGRPFKSWEFRR